MHLMLPLRISKIKVANVQQASISDLSTIHVDGRRCISYVINIHHDHLLAGKLVQKLLYQ